MRMSPDDFVLLLPKSKADKMEEEGVETDLDIEVLGDDDEVFKFDFPSFDGDKAEAREGEGVPPEGEEASAAPLDANLVDPSGEEASAAPLDANLIYPSGEEHPYVAENGEHSERFLPEEDPEENVTETKPETPEPEIDPATLFGGMNVDIPDPSNKVDIGDVLRSEITNTESAYDFGFTSDLERHPYCPHPQARANDALITFSDDDGGAQDIVNEIRENTSGSSRRIASQLRRLLHARAMVRVERDRRSGKLDRRKLHTLNRPGQSEPNRRVFQSKTEGETKKVALAVLVDQSGSMASKHKMTCARAAVVALGDAVHSLGSFGVTLQVYGFDANHHRRFPWIPGTDRNCPIRLFVYKNAQENWSRVSGRVGFMQPGGNNCDGESVRWAAKRLLEVNADRRVLIVLSDGQPTAFATATETQQQEVGLVAARRLLMSGVARAKADLVRAVTEVTEAGIDTLGVGIMTNAVRAYYPNNVILNNPRELEGVVMNALRELFTGRGR